MGPQLFSRGNDEGKTLFYKLLILQWGRSFSAAETSRRTAPRCTPTSFNGAAAFQPRKLTVLKPTDSSGFYRRFASASIERPNQAQKSLSSHPKTDRKPSVSGYRAPPSKSTPPRRSETKEPVCSYPLQRHGVGWGKQCLSLPHYSSLGLIHQLNSQRLQHGTIP